MNVIRAHSYAPVEALRYQLSFLPDGWRQLLCSVYSFIVLPANLSTTWIGLVYQDSIDADGRSWSLGTGGWCAAEKHRWFCRHTPHIFLREASVEFSAVHEAGHALAELWHAPVQELYRPERSCGDDADYMAINPDEYFACAFSLFHTIDGRDVLALKDPDIYRWLQARL